MRCSTSYLIKNADRFAWIDLDLKKECNQPLSYHDKLWVDSQSRTKSSNASMTATWTLTGCLSSDENKSTIWTFSIQWSWFHDTKQTWNSSMLCLLTIMSSLRCEVANYDRWKTVMFDYQVCLCVCKHCSVVLRHDLFQCLKSYHRLQRTVFHSRLNTKMALLEKFTTQRY